jgi:uncharacterized protein (DUF1501 family)
MNRRQFLFTSGMASAAMLAPGFLLNARPNLSGKYKGKTLVVIQLSGGNDGLNTVIPYRDDIYYKLRPTIGIKADIAHRLDDDLAFHPKMIGLKSLFDDGLVNVINNVGYPNPDRSHFRSMDIWQTASKSSEYLSTGWIGRLLDAQCPDCAPSYSAIELDGTLSLALRGEKMKGLALTDPSKTARLTSLPSIEVSIQHQSDQCNEPQVEYLQKTIVESVSSVNYVHEHQKKWASTAAYPITAIGRHLKMVAELIQSGCETVVYYVSLGGFDTHAVQPGTQNRLLEQYSQAVKVFCDDLKAHQKLEDVAILTFSEFGRRVKENAGKGTDHGSANCAFVIGGGLKRPGFTGGLPNLSDLDGGDLKYTVDFRQIYATLLEEWLEIDSQQVMSEKNSTLKLF